MSYNTGNPIGSTDPRDLFDNAETIDTVVNGSATENGTGTVRARLGRNLKTIAKIIADASVTIPTDVRPTGAALSAVEAGQIGQIRSVSSDAGADCNAIAYSFAAWYSSSVANLPIAGPGVILSYFTGRYGVHLGVRQNGGLATRGTSDTGATWSAWRPIHHAMPGDIRISTSTTLRPGEIRANGSAVSRTTYADLFAVIGTRFGAGDGSTTFNVPTLAQVSSVTANLSAAITI